MRTSHLPVEYLARASKETLESFELARLNRAANFRKEAREVLNDWVQAEVESRLARFVLERRRAQSGDARSPITEIVPLLEPDVLSSTAQFTQPLAEAYLNWETSPAEILAAGESATCFAKALTAELPESPTSEQFPLFESPATARFQLELFAAASAAHSVAAAKLGQTSSAPASAQAAKLPSPPDISTQPRCEGNVPRRRTTSRPSRMRLSQTHLLENVCLHFTHRSAAARISDASSCRLVTRASFSQMRSTAATSLRLHPLIFSRAAHIKFRLPQSAHLNARQFSSPATITAPAAAPVSRASDGSKSNSSQSLSVHLSRKDARFVSDPSYPAAIGDAASFVEHESSISNTWNSPEGTFACKPSPETARLGSRPIPSGTLAICDATDLPALISATRGSIAPPGWISSPPAISPSAPVTFSPSLAVIKFISKSPNERDFSVSTMNHSLDDFPRPTRSQITNPALLLLDLQPLFAALDSSSSSLASIMFILTAPFFCASTPFSSSSRALCDPIPLFIPSLFSCPPTSFLTSSPFPRASIPAFFSVSSSCVSCSFYLFAHLLTSTLHSIDSAFPDSSDIFLPSSQLSFDSMPTLPFTFSPALQLRSSSHQPLTSLKIPIALASPLRSLPRTYYSFTFIM